MKIRCILGVHDWIEDEDDAAVEARAWGVYSAHCRYCNAKLSESNR